MKRLVILLAFSLIMTFIATAQEKPKTDPVKPAKPTNEDVKPAATSSAMPVVDEIADKYVKALGGKEALEKINSRAVKGSFEIEAMNITGTFENYAKAPNKSATIVAVPNMGNFNTVYDGSKGYSADPMQGFRELSGAELAALKREADFYLPLNLKKNYSKLELKGKEKVGSSEAYVVEATPLEGSPEKLYFDVVTGLLVRHDAERESPQGKMPYETYYDDYKVIDGVKVAHALKQVTPAFALSIKFAEVKHNTAVEDAKFNKPSAN